MILNAPLAPDNGCVRFPAHNAARLARRRFSPHGPEALDARFKHRNALADFLAGLLPQIRGPRKYALFHFRLHHPDHYAEEAHMKSLIDLLEARKDAGACRLEDTMQ
jgi:hypothetical protein